MLSESKATMLVFFTAMISGVSIFLNKLVIASIEPSFFAFLKNSIVALLLFSVIVLFKKTNEVKNLSRKEWLGLFSLGITGGSFAFLFFFQGLKITSAVNAGFLHKIIFVFASIFAFLLLKEKMSKKLLISGILAFAALFLLFGMQFSKFGFGDLLIMVGVLLWALEITLAKSLLKKLSGSIVAFGRMFFGSIILLAFLGFNNQIQNILVLDVLQIIWILLTSILLFFYVLTFYSGLKFLPVCKATLILLAAIPLTAMLSVLTKPLSILEITANFLLVFALFFLTFTPKHLMHLNRVD